MRARRRPRWRVMGGLAVIAPATLVQAELCATVHVGPPKTGSTTIQKALLQNNSALLQVAVDRDALNVPFTSAWIGGPPRLSWPRAGGTLSLMCVAQAGMPVHEAESRCRGVLVELRGQIDEAALNSRNLLLSSEGFSVADYHVEQVDLPSMLRPAYAVHIVLVYRRFFEWVASLYQQKYKATGGSLATPRVFDAATRRHVTIRGYLRTLALNADGGPADALNAYERWSAMLGEGRGEIAVLNMHDTARGPLLEQFVCEHMCAPHACSWLRSTRAGARVLRSKANAAPAFDSLALADIVFEAARHGLLRREWQRMRTTDVMQAAYAAYARGALRTAGGARLELGVACVPELELAWVWERSVLHEARLVPEWHDVRRLRALFDAKLANSTLFCYGDAATAQPGAGAASPRVHASDHSFPHDDDEHGRMQASTELWSNASSAAADASSASLWRWAETLRAAVSVTL